MSAIMKPKHHYSALLSELPSHIVELFELIRQGNRRSEHVLGVQTTGKQKIRLKLVAEVVDAGANPLQTHGTLNSTASGDEGGLEPCSASGRTTASSSNQRRQKLAPDEKAEVPARKRMQRRRR